jgi:hypothetical protein
VQIGRLLSLAPLLLACAAPVERSTSSDSPAAEPSNEPSVADLCEHVIDAMERELAEAKMQPSEQEIDTFLAECAKEMVLERQKMADDEEYFRQARCIMAAQSLAEMAKCEPEEPANPAP